MLDIQQLKFAISLTLFQKDYKKILSNNNIDHLSDFTEMNVDNISSDNNALLASLDTLKTKHSKIIPLIPELEMNNFTVVNEFNKEELIFGKDNSLQRIYEKCEIIRDAIIPALEKYENEDILSAWKIMKSYADKEITTKNPTNIEFFMPLLQHLYLHILKDDINSKDDNEFMIQQNHILKNHGIQNIDIDMLQLCSIYLHNNNLNTKEYTKQLQQVVNHLNVDKLTSHDDAFTDFYSEGLDDIFDDNNLMISKEIDKKVPNYFTTYQTELDYRILLDKIDELNDSISVFNFNQYCQDNSLENNHTSSSQYFNQYLDEMNLTLEKIEKNISNTTIKNSDSFYTKDDKEQLVSCYKKFFLPSLLALNENNYSHAYKITTNYFTSKNNLLEIKEDLSIDYDVINLAFSIFILNHKDIDSQAKNIISSLIEASEVNNEDVSPYLYNLVKSIHKNKPIKNALQNDNDKTYNFIIDNNIDTFFSNKINNLKIKR